MSDPTKRQYYNQIAHDLAAWMQTQDHVDFGPISLRNSKDETELRQLRDLFRRLFGPRDINIDEPTLTPQVTLTKRDIEEIGSLRKKLL